MSVTKSKARRALLSSVVLTVAIAGAVVVQNPGGPLLAARPEENAGKTAQSTKHIVSIERYQYMPAVLTIRVGDTIEWKNDDDVPHTATSLQKGFDSGNLATGATWEFHATKPGEYVYYCTYHPNMKAKVIVK